MIHDRDVVVVGGVRTPFVRAWTQFESVPATELGRIAVRELIERTGVDPDAIDEVIVGNVAPPADAANIARVVSLLATVPRHVPAFTVNRNCASGFEAIVEAAYRIRDGHAGLVIAAAVESMSCVPLLWNREAQALWTRAARARGRLGKLAAISRLRPRHLAPVRAVEAGLTDPISGLGMGQAVERLAREFDIPRRDQDAFALRSHHLAASAWSEGRMREEVVAVPIPPGYETVAQSDNGIRPDTSLEALSQLPPAFDRRFGTITAGNASQITDGAVALLLASGLEARTSGLPVMGKLLAFGFAGCEPERMGIGPVLATPIALRRAGGLPLGRMDRVEINEAFAAQVLACLRAFESRKFFEERLGTAPLGPLDPERVNVNGGAIAIGHPVGASCARLVLTLLREMERSAATLGLATACVGGGQGAALIFERD
jgi:acetyl-CoA C-acetyltransferase/acetyl-CoA acyltransferase